MKRIFAVFTALLILCSGFYANAERNGSSSSKIGENISGFVSETIHGENINGAVFAQKKITVLHYFSTWSAVCINEMEYMQTAADGFPDDIGVYGLLYEDATSTPEACAELMESAGYTYDCIRLDSVLGALVSEYNMIPQTFIVNNQGVVVEHFVGEFENYGQLEQRIEHWLGYSEQNCTHNVYRWPDGRNNFAGKHSRRRFGCSPDSARTRGLRVPDVGRHISECSTFGECLCAI